MRRLFIIRKDLHLSAGKLAAMAAHCSEAYWMHLIAGSEKYDAPDGVDWKDDENRIVSVPRRIWEEYVNGSFVKTIVEARNRGKLMKAVDAARGFGLIEGKDFGLIRDNCLTELTPEDPDGRTTVGIWFKPLPDDVSLQISKKYPLYRDHACSKPAVDEGIQV